MSIQKDDARLDTLARTIRIKYKRPDWARDRKFLAAVLEMVDESMGDMRYEEIFIKLKKRFPKLLADIQQPEEGEGATAALHSYIKAEMVLKNVDYLTALENVRQRKPDTFKKIYGG